MHSGIREKIEEVRKLCQLHQVDALSLFGSTATGENHEKSDIDFLVRFSSNIPLLDRADHYFEFHDALTQLLKRNIDLVVEKSIKNPVLKEEIERTKVVLA
ncbi:MAG: nucleotidyltransferase domain-containing protein [Cyclobacteriaceae bacterium]